MDTFDSKVTGNIEALMKLKNINYSDLAKLLGISLPTVYRKKREPERYTLGELKLIARALGCGVEALIDRNRKWLNMEG